MSFEPYTSYEEIDSVEAAYILSVADANVITDIPLDDINSFFAELDEHYEDYDDGQPSWEQEWADFGECYEQPTGRLTAPVYKCPGAVANVMKGAVSVKTMAKKNILAWHCLQW